MGNLLPLEKLDPNESWQPWQPTPGDPWSRKWAAHLYRRAGFGASRNELRDAEKLGVQGTLEVILQGRTQTSDGFDDVGPISAGKPNSIDQMRSAWVYEMLRGSHPLREKMTLFWHNHFATSIAKVKYENAMLEQNRLFRKHALGKFGPFLQAVSRDEAMLIWLDSSSNIKGQPNENYARELLELFSLGVGNYTEKDIREAARAFTGWHAGKEGFWFNEDKHDDGIKTFMGQTGPWGGRDIVRIVLEQPAAARFIVKKLYQFLISETASPPDSLIEPLCDRFRKSDYDIAGLVKTMLSSRHFFSDHSFRQKIKSPVEYVLGAVRAIYRLYEETEIDYRPLKHQVLVPYLTTMGQSLFDPPNVKGWPGARAWLNTSTMLERDNFAGALALGTLWNQPLKSKSEGPPPTALDPARLLEEEKASSPEDVVRVMLELYLPGGIRPQARTRLVAFMEEGKPKGARLEQRAREAVHAILTMPEYQLN